MFVYEKKLQYPVKIRNTNPKLAKLIITQYGGPGGGKRCKKIRPGFACDKAGAVWFMRLFFLVTALRNESY